MVSQEERISGSIDSRDKQSVAAHNSERQFTKYINHDAHYGDSSVQIGRINRLLRKAVVIFLVWQAITKMT